MRVVKLFTLLMMFAAAMAQAGIEGQKLKLPDGLGSAVLYRAEPTEDLKPAVIVVHEWWGLNDYARSRAEQLAEAGYTAIALDMYGTGKVADHPKDAQAFMQAALAEPKKMNARFDTAMMILRQQRGVNNNRIYAIGYCFGGGVVLNQARRGVDLAGVASFHGALGADESMPRGTIKAKILVATGAADPFAPPEQVGAFVQEMVAAGADLELLSFPGVKHSFTNPGATAVGEKFNMPLAYDAKADRESWAALMGMLAD
jgi:dienelactone hydrolase